MPWKRLAEQHAAGRLAAQDRPRHRRTVDRVIVGGVEGVGAAIHDLDALGAQARDERLLEGEAAVIGAEGDRRGRRGQTLVLIHVAYLLKVD